LSTHTYYRCNGCGACDHTTPVIWADHRALVLWPGRTLDLCADCDERGRWLCPRCEVVHDQTDACPQRTVTRQA
jgi:hypothetical protein